MPRPDWDDYYLGIARAVAARADCTRRHVGAVIVNDRRIVATGYNGAPAGERGCLTAGACPRGQSSVPPGSSYDTGPGSCIAVHAEANALLYGDFVKTRGGILYLVALNSDGSLHPNQEPCDGCHRLIRAAGIRRVVSPASAVSA